MGSHYMSDLEEPLEPLEPDDDTLEAIDLEVLFAMNSPPGEVYETSWRRAKELLEDTGPQGAILVLTLQELEDGDLASNVVMSSGYAKIPTRLILEVLDSHLGALTGEPEELEEEYGEE